MKDFKKLETVVTIMTFLRWVVISGIIFTFLAIFFISFRIVSQNPVAETLIDPQNLAWLADISISFFWYSICIVILLATTFVFSNALLFWKIHTITLSRINTIKLIQQALKCGVFAHLSLRWVISVVAVIIGCVLVCLSSIFSLETLNAAFALLGVGIFVIVSSIYKGYKEWTRKKVLVFGHTGFRKWEKPLKEKYNVIVSENVDICKSLFFPFYAYGPVCEENQICPLRLFSYRKPNNYKFVFLFIEDASILTMQCKVVLGNFIRSGGILIVFVEIEKLSQFYTLMKIEDETRTLIEQGSDGGWFAFATREPKIALNSRWHENVCEFSAVFVSESKSKFKIQRVPLGSRQQIEEFILDVAYT